MSSRLKERTMYRLVQYRTDHGEKAAMVGPKGRKLMPVLLIEGKGLTVTKVPFSEERYMRDVDTGRKTIKGLARQYRGIGNRLGMTKAAKLFLTNAVKAA